MKNKTMTELTQASLTVWMRWDIDEEKAKADAKGVKGERSQMQGPT